MTVLVREHVRLRDWTALGAELRPQLVEGAAAVLALRRVEAGVGSKARDERCALLPGCVTDFSQPIFRKRL